jgi:thiopurine S-methyltransferase
MTADDAAACGGVHGAWLARRRDGRIAFHEGRPNDLLVHHAARLAGCRRVRVPLCGKAEDLALLAAELRALYAGAAVELLEDRAATRGKCAQSGAPVRAAALRSGSRGRRRSVVPAC